MISLGVPPKRIVMADGGGLLSRLSLYPRRTRTLYPPLSYSVVTIFMTVCGTARADTRKGMPEGRIPSSKIELMSAFGTKRTLPPC